MSRRAVPGVPEAGGSTLAAPPALDAAAPTVLYVPASRERPTIKHRLLKSGLRFDVAGDVTRALETLSEQRVDVCLLDLADEHAAMPMIRMVTQQYAPTVVVAVGDPANAVLAAEALEAGAADVLPWPIEAADLARSVINARDAAAATDRPATGSGEADRPDPLFAHSPAMRHAVDALVSAASSRAPVSLCGEPGTGRAMLARRLHREPSSEAGRRPFVTVDPGELPSRDLERVLFGMPTERSKTSVSTTTAADAAQQLGPQSVFATALGGTLFLRHLDEFPARLQHRLANLLRDGEASLEGQPGVTRLDVRVVAALDPDPVGAVASGRLRADLVDRFALRIDVPPLRRRRDDVPLLAAHLLRESTDEQGLARKHWSRSALVLLAAMPWPGNGTELRRLVKGVVASVPDVVVHIDAVLKHLPLEGLSAPVEPGLTLREARARFEHDFISSVLVRHHGRVGEAARALGIQRTNLYRKIRQLNVPRSLLSSQK